MRKIIFVKRKALTVLACALAAAAMFAAVNGPAIVGTAATTRQLPIYRVQRDQKMVSFSFDAAWGEAILRHHQHTVQSKKCTFSLMGTCTLYSDKNQRSVFRKSTAIWTCMATPRLRESSLKQTLGWWWA